MKSYTPDLQTRSVHKVAVYLQDGEYKGTVYALIIGNRPGKEVLDQSIRHVLDGEIFKDEDCLQLVLDGYIEISKVPRTKKDFIYLIDRKYAEDYMVGVRIIDYWLID